MFTVAETPRFSIDVLSQAVKDLVQDPSRTITGIEQLTDESLENASRILSKLVTGNPILNINPQNLLSQPEVLAVAGLAVTALAYAKFGPVGAGAVALILLATGCNTDFEGKACYFFPDTDEDSYGDKSAETVCSSNFEEGIDYVDNNDDCNDSTNTVNPEATEICDGIDNDCDELVDDDDDNVVNTSTWYKDGDGDFYTVSSDLKEACSQPDDYIPSSDSLGEDCDDTNPALPQTYYLDADNDTYGNPDFAESLCDPGTDYVEDNTDCDDANDNVHPGAEEVFCDDLDNDCDTLTEKNNGWYCVKDSNVILKGALNGEEAGYSVSATGDVDGNGQDDVLVAAPKHQGVGESEGITYLVLGENLTEGTVDLLSEADAVYPGENEYDSAGASVLIARDFNGNGRDEVVIGALGYDQDGWQAGAVYLVYGTNPVTDLSGSTLANADVKLIGETGYTEGNLGMSLASIDLDGDTCIDLAIGAARTIGAVYTFKGQGSLCGTSDLTGEIPIVADDGTPVYDQKLYGPGVSYVGTSISSGDIDGDNVEDLLTGASNYDVDGNHEGAAFLVYDPTSTSDADSTVTGNQIDLVTQNDASFLGQYSTGNFGVSVLVSDVYGGDNVADVVIAGSSDDSSNGSQTGAIYVYQGDNSSPLSGPYLGLASSADVTLAGEATGDLPGSEVSGLASCDFNDDGYNDLLVGAPRHDIDASTTDTGAAYLFFGPLVGSVSLGDADVKFVTTEDSARIGNSVSCGYVNDDLSADIVIGSQYAEGGTGAAYVIYGGDYLTNYFAP